MPETQLELAGIPVGGISVGGMETCIDLPRWKLAFDIGRCPDSVVARNTILFTHAHMDHMAGVAWHAATRALRGMAPPTYVVSHENAEAFADLFEVWRRLDRSDLPHRLLTVGPGEELSLGKLRVRPFRSPHRAPCQGYTLWSTKQKLLEEFRGLGSDELRDLRRAGTPITGAAETPEVAFTGDSLIEVVEREPVLREVRLLIMEVTFLDGRVSVEQARSKGHIHLDEVIERAELFENEALLFTHFSARYRSAEIRSILERRLPPGLRERVTPLLAGLR